MNTQARTVHKRTSLVFGLVAAIAVAILAVNVIQNVALRGLMRKSAAEETEAQYVEICKTAALALTNRVEGMFDSLDWYVNSEIAATGTDDEIKAWIQGTKDKRNSDFMQVFYCSADGSYIADTGATANVKDRPYFTDIMQKGMDRTLDDPVVSRSTGEAVIHVTRAHKRNGKNAGVFCGVVSLNKLSDIAKDLKFGKTGYAFILGSNGIAMYHPQSEFIMNTNFTNGLPEGCGELQALSARIAGGETGSGWAAGIGTTVKDFIVYHPIDGTPWGLAISVTESEIYQLAATVTSIMMTGTVIAVIILVILSGILLSRSIKPLTVVEQTVQGIASGNADLTQRIEVKSNNEIGAVVDGFNAFVAKLQGIVRDVKESKTELGLAGEDMSATAQDTSSAITQILANIESVGTHIQSQASSVEETAGAVNQIASNITSLETMIEGQSSGVAQASAAVEQMIGNIASVNSSVEKMAASFEALQKQAKSGIDQQQKVNERIKQIEDQSAMLQEANTVISSIAEQTNLLAMNAAIEAAHAGEAGKGFSVVADEIRKLSETSTSQSKTIGEQLKGIKDSIGSVVHASSEATRTFESFTGKINETDELMIQIKAAMEEQNEGSKQISDALHSMNDSTQEVRGASQEMSAGNQAILEEVALLQNATVEMKNNMNEMSAGARKINETGVTLEEIARKVGDVINKIGAQIDQFKV